MLIRVMVNSICTILGIVGVFGVVFDYLPWWNLLIIACSWLLITGYGIVTIRANYFLKGYHNNPIISSNTIAITFDDGPNEHTLVILDILKKYDTKATFFCIGKQIDKYPQIAKRIIAEGHVVGNHTYHHSKDVSLYNKKRFIQEIKDTDQTIQHSLGKLPLLFRPPYGVTNPTIAKAIKTTGHQVIGWNKRSLDTTIPSEKLILKRITKHLQSGDVILLHDTKLITSVVLEQLLLFLEQNHYTAVTVDELFSIPAYA